MAITTNDLIVKLGTTKTLEAAGVSIANNTVANATTVYDIAADGSNAPDAEFVLTVTFATAPTENATVDLFAAEQDIDGTADEQQPEASSYRPRYVTSFTVNNVTSAQPIKRVVRGVPTKAIYTLYNNGTGQTISAGWTLKVTPRTVGPA